MLDAFAAAQEQYEQAAADMNGRFGEVVENNKSTAQSALMSSRGKDVIGEVLNNTIGAIAEVQAAFQTVKDINSDLVEKVQALKDVKDRNSFPCMRSFDGEGSMKSVTERHNEVTATLAQLKADNAEVMMKLLTSVKEPAVKPIVASLDQDQVDYLMKYIYRLLGTGENCTILLKWHESAFEAGGLGCIVRAICERRTV